MNDLAELNKFANRYAKAWCSQNPESVAAFFAENGSLSVNDGPPAIGRAAIAEAALGFMRDFPDMVVTMDDVTQESRGTVFHWTLTGTNTGPGGMGKRVRINGYELWQFDNAGLIENSKGHFDSAEYERQLKHGVNGQPGNADSSGASSISSRFDIDLMQREPHPDAKPMGASGIGRRAEQKRSRKPSASDKSAAEGVEPK